ncbi:hypothetical protein GWK47_017255 [Chionoecetes opilio]|uniref:Uncharacterized protein n=1 Tax=Chionoecetes opilio TaxID=41210 RepID=A0A8J4XU06_CHIOP|nr:hypothetical protein GWK47_017255 [Chionoecetes opilio]
MAKGNLRSEGLPLQRSIRAGRSRSLGHGGHFPSSWPSCTQKWNEAWSLNEHPQRPPVHARTSLEGSPNPGVRTVALKASAFTVWYVLEDLVALSFMDERISNEEKEAMVRTTLFRRERKKASSGLDGKRSPRGH